jgi:two-component system chemotaxis sensor kinase CheA
VVRQQLEAVQGHISVDSLPGEGATIHLFVPTTLTMSRGLLVQVGDERYVLPLHSILKIIEPQQTFTVAGQTMITVEDVPLPLVPLASLLERRISETPPRKPLVVIMAVAEQRLALLVDDVLTEQELAVKPLGKPLQRVRNVAGTALMGDGRPVVILNAADMVRAAKGVRRHAIAVIEEPTETQEKVPVRILVVDDSITTRTLEKNILETAGYEVITATDGEQALQRLNEYPIDLVVSDVEMPVMDGITLTRRLRDTAQFKDLPLILVTSLESQDDRERGMVAGADAYIVKRGFDQAELLKTVQRLIFIEETE